MVLVRLLVSGEMKDDIFNTVRCITLAIGLSLFWGFVGGVLVYALPRLRRMLDPLLATYYAFPHFILYPLLLVLFGMGPLPLIILGFLSGVIAMVINTLNGLDRIPLVYRKTARVLRMGRVRTSWFIILPSAASYIFTGVKLAVAYAFIGIIGGEFILSAGGIGNQISALYYAFDNEKMYAVILFVLILVILINMVLQSWEAKLASRQTR